MWAEPLHEAQAVSHVMQVREPELAKELEGQLETQLLLVGWEK